MKKLNYILLILLLFSCSVTSQKNGVHLDNLQKVSEKQAKCSKGKVLSYSPVSSKDMLTTTWVYECQGKKFNCSFGDSGPICL